MQKQSETFSTKIEAIGPSIIQATFSRALIMPLQIGLAVDLHDGFASKYLMDTLHQLGFCKLNKKCDVLKEVKL